MNEKLFLYSVIGCIAVINIMDVNCYKLVFDAHSLLSKYADQPDLWQLDISNQTSFELPKERVLMYHKKLARFYCNNCSVHSIYKLSFSMIPQLTHLELDNNNLSHIHMDAFENNKLLQKVQLIGNNLVHFNAEAMLRHASLSCLILDQNPRFDINDVTIQTPWLVYLSCKHCNTSIIEKSTMKQWKRLGHLHLSYNNINRIDSDAFKDLIRFKHLNVDGNPDLKELSIESKTILNVSAESCGLQGKLDTSSLEALECLNVRKNKISKIVEHGFFYNKNMKRILLDDNEIEKIPEKLLETPLYELEALCIDQNPLQPRELLRKFVIKYSARKLRRRCLDDDNPTHLFERYLSSKTGKALYRKLMDSDLINKSATFQEPSSKIVYIESTYFEEMSNVTTVILDGNRNLSLPINDIFLQSDFIFNLSLAFCDIKHIYDETFINLPNIRSINLRGNRIKSMHSHLLFQKNTKIENLDLSENDLTFIVPNLFEELRFFRTLNLQKNRLLTTAPGNIFLVSSSLYNLNCHQCNFAEVDNILFSGVANLRVLNLSQNSIASVHENAFGRTKDIQTLDLSQNRLQHLSPDLMHLAKLEQMCLSGNSDFNFSRFVKRAFTVDVQTMLDLEINCRESTFSQQLQNYSKEFETFQPNSPGSNNTNHKENLSSAGSLNSTVDYRVIILLIKSMVLILSLQI